MLTPVSNVPKSTIRTRWTFKVKTDGRFKARLVALGWKQINDFDCGITFASACRRVKTVIV